jgi:hypothetical protein
LPGSKRYAKTKAEWDILLSRQNELLTDLLGDNAEILLVTGDYYNEGINELHPISEVKLIANISFVSLDYIDSALPGLQTRSIILSPPTITAAILFSYTIAAFRR